jgi:hypothetical protein
MGVASSLGKADDLLVAAVTACDDDFATRSISTGSTEGTGSP